MVKVREDLTDRVFGRLTVIEQTEDHIQPSGKHRSMWLCQCSCENKTIVKVRGSELLNGHTTSCGCYNRELLDISRKRRKGNKNDLSGAFGVLWSYNTNEEIYFDLEDAEKILKYTWSVNRHGYAVTCVDKKHIKMHHLIGCKGYDHADRNKLNNQKENLRPCVHKENDRNQNKRKTNTSGFIGVFWSKDRCKWCAQIKVDYTKIFLGRFDNKNDAIKARLEAEKKYFGDFAPQRHLFEEYGIKDGDE